jgi:hypothetical protein
VVRNLTRPDYVVAEYFSGTDAAVGAPPLTIGATRPGGLAMAGVPGVAKGPTGAPQPGAAAAGQAVTVSLSGPQQVQAGGQFATQLGLSGPSAASATMELVYDPALLEALPKTGEPTALLGAGRIRVRLAQPGASGGGQPTAQVSFRVIAKEMAVTALRVENVEAQDPAGNPFPTAAAPQQMVNIQRPAATEAKPAPPLDTRPESVLEPRP